MHIYMKNNWACRVKQLRTMMEYMSWSDLIWSDCTADRCCVHASHGLTLHGKQDVRVDMDGCSRTKEAHIYSCAWISCYTCISAFALPCMPNLSYISAPAVWIVDYHSDWHCMGCHVIDARLWILLFYYWPAVRMSWSCQVACSSVMLPSILFKVLRHFFQKTAGKSFTLDCHILFGVRRGTQAAWW